MIYKILKINKTCLVSIMKSSKIVANFQKTEGLPNKAKSLHCKSKIQMKSTMLKVIKFQVKKMKYKKLSQKQKLMTSNMKLKIINSFEIFY